MMFTVDTETTGLEEGSRLVEIHSAMMDDSGAIVDTFHRLVNPCMSIPSDASKIHGITDQDVKDAKTSDKVLSDWRSWIDLFDAKTVIAHYAPYDVGILGYEISAGFYDQPDFNVVDTCAMAKAIKATPKNNLDTLVEHYKIQRQGKAHRAESDSLACRDYFLIARSLTEVTSTKWSAPHTHVDAVGPLLGQFLQDIAYNRAFSFSYTDAKGSRSDRTIIPYGYASKGGKVYFHGLCTMRNERRTFLAERAELP